MLIEVWIEDWEIHCCRPNPSVGQAWAEVVVSDGEAVPADGAPPEVTPHGDGTTTVVGDVVEVFPSDDDRPGAGVVRAGCLHVYANGAGESGRRVRVTGRLHEERHSGAEDEQFANSGGVVRRVSVAPLILEARPPGSQSFEVVGEGPEVDVEAVDPAAADDFVVRLEVEIDVKV